MSFATAAFCTDYYCYLFALITSCVSSVLNFLSFICLFGKFELLFNKEQFRSFADNPSLYFKSAHVRRSLGTHRMERGAQIGVHTTQHDHINVWFHWARIVVVLTLCGVCVLSLIGDIGRVSIWAVLQHGFSMIWLMRRWLGQVGGASALKAAWLASSPGAPHSKELTLPPCP